MGGGRGTHQPSDFFTRLLAPTETDSNYLYLQESTGPLRHWHLPTSETSLRFVTLMGKTAASGAAEGLCLELRCGWLR